MNEVLLKLGFAGVVIMALVIAIRYLVKWVEKKDKEAKEERQNQEKLAREERAIMLEKMQKMTEKHAEVVQEISDKHNKIVQEIADDYNKSTKENTSVLSRLTTLLETRNGNKR